MSRPILRFLSPGVKTQEIDESQIADPITQLGPIIIGRTRKGPAGGPTQVSNLDDFNSVFGKPVDGAPGDDVWRNGIVGPTYASYAAHAWLASETTPVNIVRQLGEEDPDNPSGERAGWEVTRAYGLFIAGENSRSGNGTVGNVANAALAAVFYASGSNAAVTLSGNIADDAGAAAAQSFLTNPTSIQGPAGHNQTLTVTLAGTLILTITLDNGVAYDATPTLVGDTHTLGIDSAGTDAAIMSAMAHVIDQAAGVSAVSATNVSITITADVIDVGQTVVVGGSLETGVHFTVVNTGATEATSTGVGEVIEPVGDDLEFVAQIQSDVLAGTKVKDIRFNFNRASERYIRNVFNTNPTLINQAITPSQDREIYWLGETFERHVKSIVSDTAQTKCVGFILPLVDKNSKSWGAHKEAFTYARSGWFVSQDFGASNDFAYDAAGVEKLFRCVALGGGAADNTAFYIGITDLKLPANTNINPYSTFTLNVVEVGSNSVLESFPSLSFDPNSPDNILKRIGDKYLKWVTTDGIGKYEEVGENPNRSSYIRIEMYSSSNTISNKSALPFGFLGPIRPKPSANELTRTASGPSDWVSDVEVNTFGSGSQGSTIINHGDAAFKTQLVFPKLPLRISGSDGLNARPSRAYFGVQPTITAKSRQYDADYIDYLRPIANSDVYNYGTAALLPRTTGDGEIYEYSCLFSLDNVVLSSSTENNWIYSGSSGGTSVNDGARVAGQSYTAANGVSALLDKGVKRFYAPMHGGFDGLDITEREPLGNHLISASSTKENNYVFYTLDKALQAVSDPEVVPANLLLAPGVRKASLTDKILQTAEERNDLLAIVDLEGDFTPATERSNVVPLDSDRGSVATAVDGLNARPNTDTSYGCCFYPAIQVVDRDTARSLYVPSSVAGLGAMAQSQRAAELWFAPAGFNRGGLGNLGGRRGPTAVQARQRLDSSQRDDLYEANINPIATFPNEGLVIFGQKTLQRANSALNRINVRRLMIFLRHQISEIAKLSLFEQNNSSTRSRLRNEINNVLSDVQSRFGVTEYAIILDERNNSADDIDNNRLNVSIFVKPTRAIEFIAIDFIITRSGVELVQ